MTTSIGVRRPVGHGTIRARRGRGGCGAGFPAGNPYAIGTIVLGNGGGGAFAECAHSVTNIFNSRLGNISHVGIVITYSNPGTLVHSSGAAGVPAEGARLRLRGMCIEPW